MKKKFTDKQRLILKRYIDKAIRREIKKVYDGYIDETDKLSTFGHTADRNVWMLEDLKYLKKSPEFKQDFWNAHDYLSRSSGAIWNGRVDLAKNNFRIANHSLNNMINGLNDKIANYQAQNNRSAEMFLRKEKGVLSRIQSVIKSMISYPNSKW